MHCNLLFEMQLITLELFIIFKKVSECIRQFFYEIRYIEKRNRLFTHFICYYKSKRKGSKRFWIQNKLDLHFPENKHTFQCKINFLRNSTSKVHSSIPRKKSQGEKTL